MHYRSDLEVLFRMNPAALHVLFEELFTEDIVWCAIDFLSKDVGPLRLKSSVVLRSVWNSSVGQRFK